MLLRALLDFFHQQGMQRTYWIAYSGGLDSHVLLALCQAIRKEYPLQLRAIHINHHIHPEADNWARHCEKICRLYQIDFIKKDIYLDLTQGDSLEASARNERYQVFAELLAEGEVLLTAHQQDDQAETVLLQLLRGAGPKGLAAMPTLKSFALGFHARPLLTFSRQILNAYANECALDWIEDDSNSNPKYMRNFIRHNVMPLLIERWPAALNVMTRSALHCAESQALLEEFSLDALKKIQGSNEKTLSVKQLLQLSDKQQRLLLRTWINCLGYALPDTKKIETIRNNMLLASSDRMPQVRWGNVEIRRFRDDLYLMNCLSKHETNEIIAWNISKPLHLPGIGTLSAKQVLGMGLQATIQQVSVRFRQGGEVIHLANRGRHTLKNLLQEWRVPTWERDRLPLLFVNEQCIAAVGYFLDDHYAAKQGEVGYQPHLDRA